MGALVRYEDWEQRLAEYVELKRNEPFKWGANDCALFALGALKSVKADFPSVDLTFGYKTKLGAYAWLKKQGAEDLWDFVDRYFDRVPIEMVQRGDLVAHITEDRSVGIWLGAFYCTPSDDGLLFSDSAEFAWRIS